MPRGLSLEVVVSTDNVSKFVEGDVRARVRDGRKGRGVTVRLKIDGGVEGDT